MTYHMTNFISDPKEYKHSPRMFHLHSVSGVFEAHEIVNPSRHEKTCSPFGFLQSDIYNVSQPGKL